MNWFKCYPICPRCNTRHRPLRTMTPRGVVREAHGEKSDA